eukprot:TRINITY_DN113_c0_g1_i3.p1 TRINITY_DN113_c0_g1~~TRINITY_DN113_c0_g1_i3.p1  ORF type:complete len:362 (+),score=76.75 TRINITY_DN113_c0_g1_i3:96-1181(+)
MALQLLSQESPYSEAQSKNGDMKVVHYVVKNCPFTLRLSVEDTPLDFTSAALQCTLFYDLPELKLVESVASPFDYVMTPLEHGKQCTMTARIKVLTSQHSGSHFVIKIRLTDGKNAVETYSQPIKSCSKLDAIRRKIAEQEGQKVKNQKKKRARSDELIETLEEIRRAQDLQTQLLTQMVSNPPRSAVAPTEKKTENKTDLVSAVDTFLQVLSSISETERPSKIRKILSDLSPSRQCVLTEFVRVCDTASPQSPSVTSSVDSDFESSKTHIPPVTSSVISLHQLHQSLNLQMQSVNVKPIQLPTQLLPQQEQLAQSPPSSQQDEPSCSSPESYENFLAQEDLELWGDGINSYVEEEQLDVN